MWACSPLRGGFQFKPLCHLLGFNLFLGGIQLGCENGITRRVVPAGWGGDTASYHCHLTQLIVRFCWKTTGSWHWPSMGGESIRSKRPLPCVSWQHAKAPARLVLVSGTGFMCQVCVHSISACPQDIQFHQPNIQKLWARVHRFREKWKEHSTGILFTLHSVGLEILKAVLCLHH